MHEISAWVLGPPRDITRGVHSPRRLPSPRYVPSSGVLNLSTAYSTTQLCRLISSCSRVQGVPVQGILSPHSGLPRRKYSCPLAVGSPCTRQPKLSAMLGVPRLRGFDPRGAALVSRAVIHRQRASLPSSGSDSSRSPRRRRPSYLETSAHEVIRRASYEPLRAHRLPDGTFFSVLSASSVASSSLTANLLEYFGPTFVQLLQE